MKFMGIRVFTLRGKLRYYLVVALLALFAATTNAAPDVANQTLIGERPHAGGEPDVVSVGVALLDITGIDDREQSFTVDAYVEISWQDRRLASGNDPGRSSGLKTLPASAVWTPGLTIVNNRGLNFLLPETVTVDQQGNVIMRQRMVGPLAVDLKLHDFPFDTQRLMIRIVSYRYSPNELVFSDASEVVSRVDEFSADGWGFETMEPERSLFRVAAEGVGRPQLTFGVVAFRNAGYYLFTLAMPIALVLCLAWMVHWLPLELVPTRLGMSSASVFSVIAFGVSFRLTLPKIDYLTYADKLVVCLTLLVLLSLVATVLATRWASGGRMDAAVRLTRVVRLGLPIVFAFFVALLVLS